MQSAFVLQIDSKCGSRILFLCACVCGCRSNIKKVWRGCCYGQHLIIDVGTVAGMVQFLFSEGAVAGTVTDMVKLGVRMQVRLKFKDELRVWVRVRLQF